MGPTLALRDDGALLVTKRKIAELTPVGKAELSHRQRIERDLIGRYAVPFGALLFVGGVVLMFYGLPRLRLQETMDQRRSSVELDKLLSEFTPQTDDERQASIRDSVDEDLSASGSPLTVPTHVGRSIPSSQKPVGGMIARAREVEDAVISRVRVLAAPLYEVRAQVRYGNAGFDAVLLSAVDQLPDVVIEIKYSEHGAALGSITRIRVEQAASLVLRYEAQTGRTALGWLILVVGDTSDREALTRRTAQVADQFAGKVRFSIVASDEVSRMAMPDLRAS